MNDEIIPYGNPLLYDYVKYGRIPDTVQLGHFLFFVDLNLEEGKNIIEFILGHSSDEFPAPIDHLAIETLHIHYETPNK